MNTSVTAAAVAANARNERGSTSGVAAGVAVSSTIRSAGSPTASRPDSPSPSAAAPPLVAIASASAPDCTPGQTLRGASSVAVSPDGRYVYAAAFGSDAVGVFKRVITAIPRHAG